MAWNVPLAVAPDLAQDLVAGWSARIEGRHTLVPDGCVDVLWIDSGRAVICGPETRAWSFSLPPGTEAVGVRFRPGRHAAALRLATAEIRNRRVTVEDVFGTRAHRTMVQQVGDAPEPAARVRVLQDRVRRWLSASAPDHDRAADAVVRMLTRDIATPVGDMATATGLSERQLHRRCLAAFGYGPSVLRRILRLQRFLRIARHPGSPVDVATLAAVAGYTDQAHLSRDCREIAGLSPRTLMGRDDI